uniref:Uncharacterized protein n=1 Tax=viral metagenome TaxID=1070528 RepID=A0A6C0CJZ5_9ZZZZ
MPRDIKVNERSTTDVLNVKTSGKNSSRIGGISFDNRSDSISSDSASLSKPRSNKSYRRVRPGKSDSSSSHRPRKSSPPRSPSPDSVARLVNREKLDSPRAKTPPRRDDRKDDSSSLGSIDSFSDKDRSPSRDRSYDRDDRREDRRDDRRRESSPPNVPYKEDFTFSKPLTKEEEDQEKCRILLKFDRLRDRGIRVDKDFTMHSDLKEMQYELERITEHIRRKNGTKFAERLLVTGITGIEWLNTKFDPIGLYLDGFSDSIANDIDSYDDVMEDLYVKYRGKAEVAPELTLLFSLLSAGTMYHLQNSHKKKQLPASKSNSKDPEPSSERPATPPPKPRPRPTVRRGYADKPQTSSIPTGADDSSSISFSDGPNNDDILSSSSDDRISEISSKSDARSIASSRASEMVKNIKLQQQRKRNTGGTGASVAL